MNLFLRPAVLADLPVINDIYNHYVLHSTCTYQDQPDTPAEREAWFHQHGERLPIKVAIDTADEHRVIGWGALSLFRTRSAYRWTVENSIYIHPAHHRKGIGAMILQDQLIDAQRLGYHVVIAGIDAEQAPSLALHRKFGFIQTAHLPEVGFKFGRWLNVIYLQKTIERATQG